MEYLRPFILLAILIIAGGCSRPDLERSIVGTWEWTGDRCCEDGQCGKEIITDGGTRETFTADGLYLSGRARTGYKLKGASIYFSSDKSGFTARHADIVSIRNGVMLLRFDDGIRRYEIAGGKR